MIELTEQQARAIEHPDATPTSYDAGSWTDEERNSVRAETPEALGWEGMETYQDDQPGM